MDTMWEWIEANQTCHYCGGDWSKQKGKKGCDRCGGPIPYMPPNLLRGYLKLGTALYVDRKCTSINMMGGIPFRLV